MAVQTQGNQKNSDIDHRLKELKKQIADTRAIADEVKIDRADCNHSMQEALAKLETRGIPRRAFRMALMYVNLDPDDRRGFDAAYQICREALGLPVQADLLDLLDEEVEEKPSGEAAENHQLAK